MESGGVSIISAKTLPTESVGNVYHNQAFAPDEAGANKEKKGSVGSIHSTTSNVANGEKSGGDAPGNDVLPPKRDSSTVEFQLPQKNPRERMRSISDAPYRGMGKEELLRYSSRPLWRNLRYICISIVLTGWLALLITVVALVLTYPSCREAQEKDWWQKTVMYRIYVRSFYDADGDGTGDIQGIYEKLDYLHSLGVDTISLSPIYKLSPNAETDTHIVDHKDIDSQLGNLHDLTRLVNATHSKGMHIVLDFIPNHTSDQHPWFVESERDKEARTNEFRSYYVWALGQGTNGLRNPNNWKSVYECSAWTMNVDNTFYLHHFLETMPELNLRSQKVRDELEDILKFWLDLGVDGFYIRHSEFLFEDYDLRDNELLDNSTNVARCPDVTDQNAYDAYDHSYTRGLSEIFDMFARWRAFLDEYGNKTNKYKMLFADRDGTYDQVMEYYGHFNRDGVDFPLNKFSLTPNLTDGGHGIQQMVSDWLDKMPDNRWPNWMGGDDNSVRMVDRLGEKVAGPYLILAMLLPGTPFFYYGDEIGLSSATAGLNGTEKWDMRQPMRGIMQWNNETHAGFCGKLCPRPWLPPLDEYKSGMNMEAQRATPESLFNLFRNLTTLRKDKPTFEYGDYIPAILDDEVFSFVREFDGEKGYLVALNFADKETKRYFPRVHDTIPGSASVEIVTGEDARHSKGGGAGLDPLTLAPYEGIVVSWDYEAKEL